MSEADMTAGQKQPAGDNIQSAALAAASGGWRATRTPRLQLISRLDTPLKGHWQRKK
jgi:hypothetical protein